jgi:phage-related protein
LGREWRNGARIDKLSERMGEVKRRWRDYQTPGGRRPVKDFLMEQCSDEERANILEHMRAIKEKGAREGGGRKLKGRIWEVRVDQDGIIHRVTFASVGGKGRILLSLDAFTKKTQKTPRGKIALAEERLKDWEERGEAGE